MAIATTCAFRVSTARTLPTVTTQMASVSARSTLAPGAQGISKQLHMDSRAIVPQNGVLDSLPLSAGLTTIPRWDNP